MKFYKGLWIYDNSVAGNAWRIPASGYSAIDLRPDSNNAGMAVFCVDGMFNEPGYEEITESAALALAKKHMVDDADPKGVTSTKPLLPDASMNLVINLGPARWEKKLNNGDDHFQKVIDVVVDDAKKMPMKLRQKFAGAMVMKYGYNPIPNVDPVKPETTITESFNKTDSSTLGPDLTWTEVSGDFEVASNQFQQVDGGVNGFARAESALSSADHYSQINFSTLTRAGAQEGGVGCNVRFNSGANTHYGCICYQDGTLGSGNAYKYIWKWVAGARTDLVTGSVAIGAVPFPVKLNITGSDLTLYFNGISVNTATDSAITGNLYTGIYGYQFGATMRGDAFEASDNLGGASTYINMAMMGVG